MSASHHEANVPEDPLASLREAVRISPENVPLRQHLAGSLLEAGRAEAAETEFKAALALAPDNAAIKLGLARAFMAQGKSSHALVIVEDLLKSASKPPPAYLLHARLLFQAGDIENAVRAYRWGVEADPSLADLELAHRLGIDADPETSEVLDGRLRAAWDDEPFPVETEIERPRITFADVGGMDPIKDEVRMKIIHPLTHADLYQAYGKPIGGGILLYGPPGCGKTYLARATAGEINAGFIAVGINDVLDMWIGNSERNLHEVFDQARRHRPCVLFFDEVDALGASRSDMRQNAGRMLINQFLAELDGVRDSNEGVLVLGATNAPWHLDSAFRRPGRFDRILFVPPPDADARAEILRLQCQGKPQSDVDFSQVGRKTEGFSGADLKAVVDLAVEEKLREAMRAGAPTPLTSRDLLAAAKKQKPTTREWFATARNYALYSNQGGVYDDILDYLKLR
ncbi:MAG: AAA family ATPase [Verrucomicrobiales bacterium]|nr:AAA family ATPase [Verrucomicrobiales bacterium]MCP5526308.1 AAA family ATPase [Verrucomicrobiales bacterium]